MAIIAFIEKSIIDFIKKLDIHFKIKNLGFIKDYLNIDIHYNHDYLLQLSQENYIIKIIDKFGFKNANRVLMLINVKTKLEPNLLTANKKLIKLF
jgi:hypothetical protein